MSYFDSLLASVGGNTDATSNPAANVRPTTVQPTAINSRPSNADSSTATNTGTATKRKAEAELDASVTKTQKIGNATNRAFTNTTAKPAFSSPAASSLTKAVSISGGDSIAKRVRPKAEEPQKAGTGTKQAPLNASRSTHQPTPGSLAELLARAKSMQTTKLGQGGGLMNKSTVKTNEEARENRKKLLESKRSKGTLSKSKGASRSGSEGPQAQKKVQGAMKSATEDKPKRKPVEVSYKGTMRGLAPSTYQGTAKLKSTREDRKEGQSRYSHDRHRRDYSESAEEDEEGYGSEGSSDMEAGAWDIDEEEEEALRAARKEDAREQRLEEELKRKKLLRKQGFGR